MFTTFYSHTYALLLQILIHYDRTYFSNAMTAKRDMIVLNIIIKWLKVCVETFNPNYQCASIRLPPLNCLHSYLKSQENFHSHFFCSFLLYYSTTSILVHIIQLGLLINDAQQDQARCVRMLTLGYFLED